MLLKKDENIGFGCIIPRAGEDDAYENIKRRLKSLVWR